MAMSRTSQTWPQPSQSGPQAFTKLIIALLLMQTVAVGFLLSERFNRRRIWAQAAVRPVTPRGDLAEDEKATIELFQRCSKAVVYITSLASRRISYDLEAETESGSGSGFVWDEQGHIVTNYHVVRESEKLLVTFANQRTVEADLVGTAPHKDLALLRVNVPASDLSPIAVGESSNLQVGQKVFAIGNPFGLDQTLTTGVISGLGREIRSTTERRISDVVQTDTAINPGNSGGPLLDSAGRLIGVTTAIASSTGTNNGVGFAIPIDTVQRVVPQLIRYRRVINPDLGIVPISRALASRAGLEGVLVKSVIQDGPAYNAGIMPFRFLDGYLAYGDLIVGINGTPIREVDDMYEKLEEYNVGDSVNVRVIRLANTSLQEELVIPVILGSDAW